MKDEIAILDFFDDEAHTTVESTLSAKPELLVMKQRIATLKIETAIITWLNPSDFEHWLKDAVFIRNVLGASCGRIPYYIFKDKYILIFMCVGAPNAAAVIEELSWFGIKNFIAYGTAGCVDPTFDQTKMIIPTKAIRDEGTSFHYLPPSLYVETDAKISDTIEKVLIQNNIPNERGTVWTTDAIFRETFKRTAKRLSQGAVAVDMECAAFAAAAKRCNVRFGQFFFFSDGITPDGWKWTPSALDKKNDKERLLDIAIQIADLLRQY